MITPYNPLPPWPLPLGYIPEPEATPGVLVATVTAPRNVEYVARWQVSWDDGQTWLDCQPE